MKTILIPTDFSLNAWKATMFALQVFKEELCVFYFLHVCEPSAKNIKDENITISNQANLKKFITKVKTYNKNGNHKYKAIIKFGQLNNSIDKLQKEIFFDLIVMGTKGETDSRNRFLGKNSLNIVEVVNFIPVLLIPEKAQFIPFEKKEIVFATRYEKEFSPYEIKFLRDFSSSWNACIRILYVQEEEKLSKKQKERKEELHLHLGNLQHSFHTLTNIEVPIGIHSFLHSRNSDLLVLNHRRKGFYRRLFLGKLSKKIDSQSKIPLLFMPSK
ncbi:Nucleotide-binding universal stress protein, UspA family [Salegentibacter echinorum]|uniref:Nucleotide-binding universal stress protein, UspA family n=1 Tax=Salegentibacter echinorum TaxID=1073325 RepID=A0A1M5FL64_SALEC|nr:universal stress protein [Salegentibacter echinorum]SHF92246.1 Nucleotide-binding universal stress protein, UspA family [Salegentibacter echinorum]